MNSPEKYEKAAGKEEEKERERHQLSNESEKKTKLGSSTIFHFFSPEQKQSRHFSSLR